MIKFFRDIFVAGSTIAQGMSITMKHFFDVGILKAH